MRLPTASKLDLFRECSGPWYLPLARQEYGKAAEKGKALHKFAETGVPGAVTGRISTAEGAVERSMADLPTWGPAGDVDMRETVVRFNPYNQRAEIIGAAKVARPYGDEDTTWIWGTADIVGCCGVDNSKLLVADLKTGSPAWLKMPWGPKGTLDGASLQVPFLAAVINRVVRAKSAVLAIVSSQAERAFTAEYASSDLDKVLDLVSDVVSHPPTTLRVGEWCTFCPVRGNCPLWQGS